MRFCVRSLFFFAIIFMSAPCFAKSSPLVVNINDLTWTRNVSLSRDLMVKYGNYKAKSDIKFLNINPSQMEQMLNIMNSTKYGGYSDWRLPTRYEMEQLTETITKDIVVNSIKIKSTLKEKWTDDRVVVGMKKAGFKNLTNNAPSVWCQKIQFDRYGDKVSNPWGSWNLPTKMHLDYYGGMNASLIAVRGAEPKYTAEQPKRAEIKVEPEKTNVQLTTGENSESTPSQEEGK